MNLKTNSKLTNFFEKTIQNPCRIRQESDNHIIRKTFEYCEKYIENRSSNIQFKDLDTALAISEIAVFEAGGGSNTFISSLLFCVLDKSELNFIELKEQFGQTIVEIIEGLTKIPDFKNEKFNTQSENFIKLLLTVSGDARSVLIRLCIQIWRMRNIEIFSGFEQNNISKQTAYLYAPIAHRLGLYKIKTELEESAMKYIERDMYKFIAEKLAATKASRNLYINNFIEPIKQLLEHEKFKFEVKGRPKSIFSIWKKMQKQGVSFEEVYDLFAIRIILDTPFENEKQECWRAYSEITNIYRPNPKRMRDWISAPKMSGYESLHATVLGPESKWVEVQIRTKRMDEIAEKGTAAHWKYKGNDKNEHADWLQKMREALENRETDDSSDNDAKAALYSGEYFIFTPDGDLKKIKPGYTVLDFAFLIHTKVGESCTGAIVDGKIRPLSYELKNGETVKILTSKTQKPNEGWLKMAKSGKTLIKIKRALSQAEHKDSAEGKELLKAKLKQLKLEFNDVNVKKISDFYGFENAVTLYQSIGEGKTDLLKIKRAFEKTEIKDTEEPIEPIQESIVRKVYKNKTDDYLIIDENISTLDYHFAKCCNPIPGDEIFGFVSVLKGTRIHKVNCPNADDLRSKYAYRVVKARWNIKNPDAAFVATILLEGQDSPGLSAAVTNLITKEFDINIQRISLSADKKGTFHGSLTIMVTNRTQFIKVIERLRNVKDILSVKEKV